MEIEDSLHRAPIRDDELNLQEIIFRTTTRLRERVNGRNAAHPGIWIGLDVRSLCDGDFEVRILPRIVNEHVSLRFYQPETNLLAVPEEAVQVHVRANVYRTLEELECKRARYEHPRFGLERAERERLREEASQRVIDVEGADLV